MGSKSGMKPSMRHGVLGKPAVPQSGSCCPVPLKDSTGQSPWAGSMPQPIHHMCGDAGGGWTGYLAVRSSFVLLAMF